MLIIDLVKRDCRCDLFLAAVIDSVNNRSHRHRHILKPAIMDFFGYGTK